MADRMDVTSFMSASLSRGSDSSLAAAAKGDSAAGVKGQRLQFGVNWRNPGTGTGKGTGSGNDKSNKGNGWALTSATTGGVTATAATTAEMTGDDRDYDYGRDYRDFSDFDDYGGDEGYPRRGRRK